jgi:hypothetical protein
MFANAKGLLGQIKFGNTDLEVNEKRMRELLSDQSRIQESKYDNTYQTTGRMCERMRENYVSYAHVSSAKCGIKSQNKDI